MRILFVLTFLIVTFPHAAFASFGLNLNQQQELDWQAQRESYRKALNLLSRGQRAQFEEAADALRDYPLYPDLLYREYSRYIGSVDKAEVDEFMRNYSDSMLAQRLRQQWIQAQADKKDWKTYLSEYRPGQYSAKYDCYYYWGQYKIGSREEAFSGARKLWLVGKSQDKACDPLFEVWKTTNRIDGDLAWERLRLAMDAKQLQLARHLESFLPRQRQLIAREWRDLYQSPYRLREINRYKAWGDDAKPMLMTGFARLIRINADLALNLWPQYARAFDFNNEEKQIVVGNFAYVLGANQDEAAEYWLAQAAQYEGNEYLAPIAIRNALRARDWVRVRRWLALVDQDDKDAPEWQYWTARADRSLGQIDPAKMPHIRIDKYRVDVLSFNNRFLDALYNKKDVFALFPESVLRDRFPMTNPDDRLQGLAGERHFYGFLASEILRQPLNLNLLTSQVTEEQLRTMANRPGMLRARELFLLGEIYQSRLEWHHMINRMSTEERSIAAHLAFVWEWNNAAILAAAQSTAYDNLEIRFPIAFKDTVLQHAESAGVEPDWVYSLIRQESAFLPMARSPVGAMGMMQIMPQTARNLARQMRIQAPSANDLLLPDANIRMGTFYMKQLMDEFNGNIILATAAYNAGPHRAKAWQPKYTSMEGDIWVETIPFRETRDYVKNILTYQAIYRHHLGRTVNLSTALASIPPRQRETTASR